MDGLILDLDFGDDIRRFQRRLDDLQRRQVAFVTARALTETAREEAKNQRNEIAARFDRPTRFTENAFTVVSANKSSLTAKLVVKRIQAGYLAIQETGGTRRAKSGRALVVPAGVRLNRYGNIPRRYLARAKTRRRLFFANIGGTGGLWQRRASGRPKLLVAFRRRARYRPRFRFADTAVPRMRKRLSFHWGRMMSKALASGR